MSLMRQHRDRVLAAAASSVAAAATAAVIGRGTFLGSRMAEQLEAAGETGPRAVALTQILLQLGEDRKVLKATQSLTTKIEHKRTMLPRYAAWVDGILKADSGIQDDILATVMVWRIDTGDYAGALPLAAYVLRHKLALPDHFDRQPAVLIAEEIAEGALAEIKAGRTFPAEVLHETALLTSLHDMPDEVRAKLHKAIGLELVGRLEQLGESGIAGARQAAAAEALRELRRARELSPAKAGVTKAIESLEREVKAAANATTTPAANG